MDPHLEEAFLALQKVTPHSVRLTRGFISLQPAWVYEYNGGWQIIFNQDSDGVLRLKVKLHGVEIVLSDLYRREKVEQYEAIAQDTLAKLPS